MHFSTKNADYVEVAALNVTTLPVEVVRTEHRAENASKPDVPLVSVPAMRGGSRVHVNEVEAREVENTARTPER